MSAFEGRFILSVLGEVGLTAPSSEEIDQGVESHIEVMLPVGMALPFAVRPGEPVLAPLGIINLRLSKEEALELFAEGAKLAETLPDSKPQSDITIASNMGEVIRRNQEMENLTG